MKKVCLFMALLILIGLAAGCKGRTNDGKVEITVVTSFGEGDGNHENYVNAYKAYEQASGHTVNDRSSVTNEAWKKDVILNFDSDNDIDVLFYFTGADADSLIKNNKVVSISEIRKHDANYAANMKDSMLPVSAADGRQYSVPVNGYWEGLYVNKKVLADCGVNVPGSDYSWDQFLTDCSIIKNKGYTPIACSLNEIPHYWFEFCTFNHGTMSNHAILPAGASDEIGAIWSEGFNDMKVLYEKGFFPQDTTTISDQQANFLMTENKAAFMLDGSWKLGWFQTNASDINDFTVTYVPAKGERKATDIVGGMSMGYYITKRAWDDPDKRQACIDFVTAMTTDEVVNTFGALSITALKNGTKLPGNADALVKDALKMTKGCTGIVLAVQDGLNPTARDMLFNDVKNIVTGKTTPQKAIDHCLAIKEETGG